MATGWFRSLHCKTNAIDDVITSNPSLSTRFSCARSQNLKDSISFLSKPKAANKKPKSNDPKSFIPQSPPSVPSISPSLTSLPLDHSSRRVIELIFLSSWASTGNGSPFRGEIGMVFRIHNPIRTITQFEQYRTWVRTQSSKSDPRCAADGNEMMRFLNGLSNHKGSGSKAIRTFAGSGGAHESTGHNESVTKRTMLVCRVIAGRVQDDQEKGPDFGSVKVGEDEIVVFDRRAVLPCFLIIYKL